MKVVVVVRSTYKQFEPGAPTVLTNNGENRIATWVWVKGLPDHKQQLKAYMIHDVQGRSSKFKRGIPEDNG